MAPPEEKRDRLDATHAAPNETTEIPPEVTEKSTEKTYASRVKSNVNMDFILDIPLEVTVELGRTNMLINDLLKLGQGSVIELSKLAGETLEILANQKPIARGEVVVVNEKYAVRLTEVISPMERIERLK
jgi:flagellar motor switch protein FliN/FliY